MMTETNRKDIQKAMAYDLLHILKQDKTYTLDELKRLLDSYIDEERP